MSNISGGCVAKRSLESKPITAAVLGDPVPFPVGGQAPSLRANVKWMSAGTAFYAICQWGMLSILAKAGSAAIVGQFALGLAISAPVFMFTNLQLRAVQTTDARSDFDFADYFTLRVLASVVAVLTIGIVASFLNYGGVTRLVISLLGVAKAIESLGDAVAGLLQKVERIHQVAISVILRGALSLAAFGIAFLSLRSLIAAVCALFLSWSAVFLGYDVWRGRAVLMEGEHFFRFRPENLKRLVAISVPLGVIMTLFSLNANIPRYLLAKYLGDSKLGIFASIAYMLQGLYVLVNAIGESASARLARMFAMGDADGFRKLIEKLLGMGGAIFVLGPVLARFFGRTFLTILYRPEYADSVSVLAVMLMGGGVTAIGYFLGFGINAARRFRLQVPVIAFSTLTTTALTGVLVPRLGIMGAALALFVGALVHAAGNAIALRSALRPV